MADTVAVFAFAGMAPSPQDKAITAATVAGLVAPRQARGTMGGPRPTHGGAWVYWFAVVGGVFMLAGSAPRSQADA